HLSLPDPRRYADMGDKSNFLLSLAQIVLAAANPQDKLDKQAELAATLSGYLARQDMTPLSVALAMSPNAATYQTLWLALDLATRSTLYPQWILAAMPLVLVLGGSATLPNKLNPDTLKGLLIQHKVIPEAAQIDGILHTAEALTALTAPRLFELSHASHSPLPLAASPEALSVAGEGVALRYILVALQRNTENAPILAFNQSVGDWGLAMMQYLGSALKTEGVTLFPISRPLTTPMQALIDGNRVRQDVALQIFVSSHIRALRDANLTPIAHAMACGNNTLHFSILAKEETAPVTLRQGSSFVWILSPSDNIDECAANFQALMRECQVQDVIFHADILPV
ncbi:MAG: hypothetical protein K2P98_06625, partial [Neisseriaceae bacterium]|nr:hypothetical protein [Neisseriaceae bacterium]